MFHWIHHLINPHCPYCEVQRTEDKVCESCETLKMQLAIANREKEQMLNSILELNKPAEVNQTAPQPDMENVRHKMMSWNVRRQMLEAEDRVKARVLAEQAKHTDESRAAAISDLEKEVGISDEVAKNA